MLTLYRNRPMRLAEAMDRLFEDAFVRNGAYAFDGYALPLDVLAKDDEYVITASTPGLKAEDLSVEVLGDTVTIGGEIFAPAPDDKAKYVLQERRYGKFARTLTLPVELDSAKAEAVIENGLLTLRVPKAEAARPKMIKVKAK